MGYRLPLEPVTTFPGAVCFIGGSGRSGTTVLKEAFGLHRECAALRPELRFFVDPDGIVDFFSTFSDSWEPYLYDNRVRRLERLLRKLGTNNSAANIYRYVVGRSGLMKKLPLVIVPPYVEVALRKYAPHYDELVDALIARLTDFRYAGRWVGSALFQPSAMFYKSPLSREELAVILRAFLAGFIGDVLAHRQARHFFDHTPRVHIWFDRLLALLPEARLVHVYRDPRDTAASFTKNNFTPSNPTHAAQMVRDIMERWWVVRSKLPPGSFMEIALEDLVARPEATLRAVSAFLGIDWDANVLTIDLGHSHAGRWTRDFSSGDQREVNRILSPVVSALGYDA